MSLFSFISIAATAAKKPGRPQLYTTKGGFVIPAEVLKNRKINAYGNVVTITASNEAGDKVSLDCQVQFPEGVTAANAEWKSGIIVVKTIDSLDKDNCGGCYLGRPYTHNVGKMKYVLVVDAKVDDVEELADDDHKAIVAAHNEMYAKIEVATKERNLKPGELTIVDGRFYRVIVKDAKTDSFEIIEVK